MKHSTPTSPKLRTITDIANEFGVARHRLAYLADRRNIRPDQIAGRVHLFGERAARYLASEAHRINH